jgi:hypothetical protein
MKMVKVISEDKHGRNKVFQDTRNNHIMTDKEFISRIKNENSVYSEHYYVRKINGQETAVSNPNGNKQDNLN